MTIEFGSQIGGYTEMGEGESSSNGNLTFMTGSMTGATGDNTQESHSVLGCNPTNAAAETATNEWSKRFACPYFKHDPRKFRDWRTCVGPGFQTIHRLKEHLYRKHSPSPNLCSRCLVSYKNPSELLEHQRSPEACRVKSESNGGGKMTPAQRSKLRTKKRDNSLSTEEEKWGAIYRILFPGIARASIPSPYYLDEDELHDASGPAASSGNRAFSQHYEEFLNNYPPHDLVEEFKEEFRRIITSAGDVNDQVEKMSNIAWRLPISTFRRYVQVSNS
ncbi:hypothetical protein EDB80DRAFT_307382 [Ilyonectria destructans]|nr:hypothetical protein EDB80DRAFT_307382 [Ilyonectria destructans]